MVIRNFYNHKKKELEDKKIVAALRQAADDYENGEIVEVHDTLLAIVSAIEWFIEEDKQR